MSVDPADEHSGGAPPTATATGYGPSSNTRRLFFNGDSDSYELWEVKFRGHLRLRKLHKVLEGDIAGVSDEDNANVFAELIQLIDDRSLSLVIRDAMNKGRQALDILREHYKGKSKNRIIYLYTELTCMKLEEGENVTDYIIKGETASNTLKEIGETVSDGLLIAMVLKGLPEKFKPFRTVIIQRDTEITFTQFKASLRAFEENEKDRDQQPRQHSREAVMNIQGRDQQPYANDYSKTVCYACGRSGHKAISCPTNRSAPNSWRGRGRGQQRGRGSANWRGNSNWRGPRGRSAPSASLRRGNEQYSAQTVVARGRVNDENDSFVFKVGYDCRINVHNKVLVDCGATAHIVNDKNQFSYFDSDFDPNKHTIELADGSRQTGVVLGKGKAEFVFSDKNGIDQKVSLDNALYIPSYKQNIFSVQSATSKGACVNFNPQSAELIANNGTKFEVEKCGRLYYLNSMNESNKSRTIESWHKTMGHCNIQDVLKLEKVVDGMKIVGENKFVCETCIQGKMPQYRNRIPDEKAKEVFELVHTDLAGPIEPISKEGHKYALMFVDDFSSIHLIYFLKRKSDTLEATKKFLADIAPHGRVKRLRSDNGTEFTSQEFKDLMVENKIRQEFSAPYSPHQNGTVERGWRTIFEMARCLLLEANLPKFLWTYAAMTVVYIRNRCFNNRLNMTPYQALTGKKPDLSKLHIFGNVCYAYVQDKKKLDATSKRGIFVGYDKYSPAYFVYFPVERSIRRVRCVKFLNYGVDTDVDNDTTILYDTSRNPVNRGIGDQNVNVEPDQNVRESDNTSESNSGRYSLRENINRPKYLDDYVTNVDYNQNDMHVDYCYRMVTNTPSNYEEAIFCENLEKWKEAMKDEFEALGENDTFEYVTLPPDKNLVGSRWVYCVKSEPNGEERYKARFVAKGFSQVKGIDYQETFSPTAQMTSIRMLLQLAVQEGMVIHQMDVKTAYLNAPIDTELYIEQPKGFERYDSEGSPLVCKLKKSLYGLKQSGRNWNNVLHDVLTQNGFKQSLSDTCMYTKLTNVSKVVIIVWVDDIIIAGPNNHVISEIKCILQSKFKMKDMGLLSWFLSIQFENEEGCIKMNQTKLIEQILNKFQMINCKPKSTPCDLAANKLSENDSKLLDDVKLYQSMVGSLIYIMSCTRPDICYSVTMLSQYLTKPTMAHLNCAKHVLKYLSDTKDRSLVFERSHSGLKIVGHCDSDWANSPTDRKSISGFCFQLHNTMISWKSKKQQNVALSTCEAEYVALAFAIQEALSLRQLYSDMSGRELDNVIIQGDNQGSISLAKNPVNRKRSKHIDIRYHFIRDHVEKGTIILNYVPTESNRADMFTKPVSRKRLNDLYFNV